MRRSGSAELLTAGTVTALAAYPLFVFLLYKGRPFGGRSM